MICYYIYDVISYHIMLLHNLLYYTIIYYIRFYTTLKFLNINAANPKPGVVLQLADPYSEPGGPAGREAGSGSRSH